MSIEQYMQKEQIKNWLTDLNISIHGERLNDWIFSAALLGRGSFQICNFITDLVIDVKSLLKKDTGWNKHS